MKKKVLRVVAGTSLMMAMAIGVQMNNVQSESPLMMENLNAIAMAGGEVTVGAICRTTDGICAVYEEENATITQYGVEM